MLAELLFGPEKSARREQNRARVRRLTETLPMLPVGLAVVDRYAVVRAQAERVGRPESDFDLVIACTALAQGATLVTHAGGSSTDDELLSEYGPHHGQFLLPQEVQQEGTIDPKC